eukprot:TRINITY_DN74713_c0_g1_i1.p1 TRINITY_DN74713_c0_g1~~TRINITY_DN74713_c0_g1_i1.p1  ORF type:complete len:403 (+),score=65.59 TRINITY_DN74713_c0_g1_i1:107-1315(+)
MPPRFRPPALVLPQADKTKLPNPWLDRASQIEASFSWGKVLGSGSYGVVKEARRSDDGHAVAVKQVNHSGDEEVGRVVRQEYELLRTLKHESIVIALDLHELPSASWLCLELCEGGSLTSQVDHEGALSECRMRILSRQLVNGLSYLHAKRVVHRDIKPDNLLLKDAKHLKIIDFGSAKQIGNEEVCSVMLTDRGSSLFSAPEMVFGKSWNERVDVWSCGLCCYFMCQASLPFDMNKTSVKQSFMHGSLIAIEWKHTVSDLAEMFIVRCLTVDPNLRPPMLELTQEKIFAEEIQQLQRSGSAHCLTKSSSSCSLDASDWQESRIGNDLFQRLADNNLAREWERKASQGSVESSDADSFFDMSPKWDEGFAAKHQDHAPSDQKRKRRAKFFTTHGGEHNLIVD